VAILIGLVLAAGVLWAWLAGHWFGRVLAFIVLGALFGLAAAQAIGTGSAAGPRLLAVAIGIALAWPVAGIPIYWRRHRDRSLTQQIGPAPRGWTYR
jgi:hypothetical protein